VVFGAILEPGFAIVIIISQAYIYNIIFRDDSVFR
jgi:hypothetical protein